MKVVWLENDFLRIGILVGRGSDIFEFRFKPFDCDFMLYLPKGIHNPLKDFSQMKNTPNQLEDYYSVGWQEHYSTQAAPWWGNTYAIALEPWTSRWTPDPKQAINNSEWLSIPNNGTISTKLSASAIIP